MPGDQVAGQADQTQGHNHTGAAAGATTGAAAQTTEGQAALDSASFYKKAHSEGAASAQRAIEDKIKSTFGVSSLDELVQHADKIKKPATMPEEAVKEIEKARSESAQLKADLAKRDQRQIIIESMMAANVSANDLDILIYRFDQKFEVKEYDGKPAVYERGKTIPVFVGNTTTVAGVKDVLSGWAKDPSTAWMFKQVATGSGHMDTSGGTNGGASWFPEQNDILSNPRLLAAIEASGQYRDFMSGKPIDKAKVEKALK